MFKIQHSEKHVKTFKFMETLFDMKFAMVIMTYLTVKMKSSAYGADSNNK